jgi:hypothetical protein
MSIAASSVFIPCLIADVLLDKEDLADRVEFVVGKIATLPRSGSSATTSANLPLIRGGLLE